MSGMMAEFKVQAVRTDNDKQKVRLVIHGKQVVAETEELDLSSRAYEELFGLCKAMVEERIGGERNDR